MSQMLHSLGVARESKALGVSCSHLSPRSSWWWDADINEMGLLSAVDLPQLV